MWAEAPQNESYLWDFHMLHFHVNDINNVNDSSTNIFHFNEKHYSVIIYEEYFSFLFNAVSAR